MIVIDGQESSLNLAAYANLEEALLKLSAAYFADRIVTDILINDTPFVEQYPHEAETIAINQITRLEIRTSSQEAMIKEILKEMIVVVDVMGGGARKVAELLRDANEKLAYTILTDTVEVSRDFLQMVAIVCQTYPDFSEAKLIAHSNRLIELMEEINEVLEMGDSMLVADLLAYEYIPLCEGWRVIIADLTGHMGAVH